MHSMFVPLGSYSKSQEQPLSQLVVRRCDDLRRRSRLIQSALNMLHV